MIGWTLKEADGVGAVAMTRLLFPTAPWSQKYGPRWRCNLLVDVAVSVTVSILPHSGVDVKVSEGEG